MDTFRTLLRSAVITVCAAGLFAGAPARADDQPILLAAGDCYGIGQQIAAENGGTLAKASQSTQGGQSVCVIVVLVPGKDGQRPRRQEFVVPN